MAKWKVAYYNFRGASVILYHLHPHFSPLSLSESVPSHWQCFLLHLASLWAWHTESEFPSQIFLTVKFLKSIFTDTLKKGRCHSESGLSMPTVSISCLLCSDTVRAQATCQAERCPQRSRVPLVYRLSSFPICYRHLKIESLSHESFLKYRHPLVSDGDSFQDPPNTKIWGCSNSGSTNSRTQGDRADCNLLFLRLSAMEREE